MVLLVCVVILLLFELLRWAVGALWKAGHHHEPVGTSYAQELASIVTTIEAGR
jgi:hypothetical protein